MPSSDARRRDWRPGARSAVAAALLVTALVVAGCGSTTSSLPLTGAPAVEVPSRAPAPSGAPEPTFGQGAAASATPSPSAKPGGAAGHVTAKLLHLALPTALSRSVVVADGRSVLVIGGLTSKGTTGAILALDPGAGTETPVGHLASAVHDAAGAPLGTGWLVIGGGSQLAAATVQRVTVVGGGASSAVVGALPIARADGAAVAAGGRVLEVGGGRGGVPDGLLLATRDGVHFSRFGRLAIPVRYAAVAAVGDAVYVFGGSTTTGDTDAIQRIDLATGAVRVVGHLPHAASGAVALILGGRVLLAGGMRAGRPTTAILAFDPATARITVAGRLPEALADAGVAVLGDTAYLVGGETGTAYLDSVIAVR